MEMARGRSSLGSLMILVATVGLLLSVPKENWTALGSWIANAAAMFLLGFVGFGITFLGCKLASGVGLSVGRVSPAYRKPHVRPQEPRTSEDARS